MKDITLLSQTEQGLSSEEIRGALLASLTGRQLRKVLIVPPDYTRIHSNAGLITQMYYHILSEQGVKVDILPALGTHIPVSEAQRSMMFGDIPADHFYVHDWRKDVVKIGEIPADFISGITDGLWNTGVTVEVNRRIMDPEYDLILSPGQVVPHEVIGMSNHAKNIFVGVGGAEMINHSHMIGAVYGMERMMGRDHTPVRKIFDYAVEHFLKQRPILWILTVTTVAEGKTRTHGLFIGEGRECLTKAVKLAQEKNINFTDHAVEKCVVYLDPSEYQSTWLGNKGIYRTRMMMADGGELILLGPGIRQFGEDTECDRLIRKYGYRGRDAILKAFHNPENEDLRANMSAAAHLIHGSADGRFTVTYGVREISGQEIQGVGFRSLPYEELVRSYDPERLKPGFNTVNGETIFYIPNPALGLWIDRERFEREI
ncbi:MAG: DUF2088 domain-containing protein [Eubacterium sp.]|nr:DUF2088 domain-containing protein [Eubacterium sp.]